jgi:phosphatidylinositol alpha-mannosyltransferase
VKIGFILDDSLDKTDGVQQYILTLGHWLKSEGHEVHYLVGQTEREDIAHVHSLARNIQAHFNQNRMSTPLPSSKKRIVALLNKERFDILHVQMPYSPFMAGRIIKAAPKKTAVIGTFHIIPFSLWEKLATRLLGLILQRNLRRFDNIVSVSEPAARFARHAFKVHSTVLPNAVNSSQFHAGGKLRQFADGKINIVFLGRLVERKGCMYMLKAVEELHKKNLLNNVRVLVCGKGPLLPELEKYSHAKHLGAVVRFMGFINEIDKPRYLATADIAVFPSTGGESFGIVLLEAMAAGADVVIGGNNVGYRFVLGSQPDQLVDPKNIKEFARILKHFILHPKARQKAKNWQQQKIHEFDVRNVGNELLGIYTKAIAKHR